MTTVEINLPSSGQLCGHKVQVAGTITGAPEGAILRTVVVPGAVGTYHPQAGRLTILPEAGTWSGRTYIGSTGQGSDTGEEFEILVVECTEEAEAAFDRYLAGAAAEGWPGLTALPEGAAVLQRVKVVRDDGQVDKSTTTEPGTDQVPHPESVGVKAILDEAVAKVPVVKWGLAVAGFGAAAAIIGGLFSGNWLLALAATISVIVLAVPVILLSLLPSYKKDLKKFSILTIKVLGTLFMAWMVLATSSFFFGWPLDLRPQALAPMQTGIEATLLGASEQPAVQ